MQTALNYQTNRDLFSNYYLNEHLPETKAWDELTDDELREAKADIMELWDRERETAPKRNESQLEEKFIRPMFRKLGIPFEVEESTSRTQRRPDYGFFESEDAAREAFERREKGDDFYKNAVAVADAKRWGRPLDTRGSGEHERDFENPSYQIHVYLQETPARWAVLTDGRKWRLYYSPTSHRLDSYYEIDLPTVLEEGDLEDFKYFYLFFRHDAFLEDASGDCFLDDVYDESNVFARELGEDLQDNIYEAIKVLAEGFIKYPDSDLSEDDLDLIHDSSLIYLYRLIFVLYAESEGRDLLDTNNEIYEASYSLNSLKQDIAEELDSPSSKYRDWQNNLWDRLDELFKLIDQGSKSRGIPREDLYIPAYNGGLFRTDPDEDDSAEARFIANHQVGDAYLAEVIELLTRSENGNGGGKIFVDYSSLDVRHLGSIYEGLLEYKLHVADEQLAVKDDNGEYVSAEEDDEVVVEEGEIYLTTDSGERKATGSYYTPEYVVEYIVENTLGPLVENIRKDLAGQTAHGEGGFAGEFADRIFELKVLDPAMGSGHFLTSAVDYLAREIIDAQEKQAAQEGIQTVDEQRDINWARRQVAQRCIYGVDLNPLAVELAKVSLWLRTLAAEQPLAFLDHHLKTGNSLVGSDIETVLDNGDPDNGTDQGQLTLQESFDRTRRQSLKHVTDRFEDLLAIDNETLNDIKEMEAVYEEVRDDPLYQHLIALANVHTAEKFGLDVPDDAYKRMAEALQDDSWESIEEQDWYRSAQVMAKNQHFFHWELEFPIAFYEQNGERKQDGGFDAVIGNPPYVIEYDDEYKNYLEHNYDSFIRNNDQYTAFMQQGIQLCSNRGFFSFITPNTYLAGDYFDNLKKTITTETAIHQIVDFGIYKVFSDADVYCSIIVCEQCASQTEPQEVAVSLNEGPLENNSRIDYTTVSISPEDSWKPNHPIVTKCEEKAEFTLGEIANVKDVGFNYWTEGRGKTRGQGSIGDRVLYSGERESEKDIPYIKGGDFDRYAEPSEPNNYLRYDWEDQLDPEHDTFRFSPEYLKVNEKIVYRQTANKIRATLDREGHLVDKTVHVVLLEENYKDVYSHEFILALLNSNLYNFVYMDMVNEVGRSFAQVKRYRIRQLPIRKIPLDNWNSFRSDLSLEEYRKSLSEVTSNPFPSTPETVHELIIGTVNNIISWKNKYRGLNLNLLDYLGIPGDELPETKAGKTIEELQMPVAGVADTPMTGTTEDYEGLRIEKVSFADKDGRLVLSIDISYKIDEDDPRETDRWNRLAESEFETYETMAFVGLSEVEKRLLCEFVPVAVEKAGGFAGFRRDATKTNSPLDRLKDLTLPSIDKVQTGLEQYIEVRERADKLEEKIQKSDQVIDKIVYDLYGLTDKEIKTVESTVQDD